MRTEFRSEELLIAPMERAFVAAVDDTLDVARAHARRHSETGKFERSLTRTEVAEVFPGRFEARIGSPLVSARAKERGAFIQAKRGPYLVFNAGDGVRKVRSVRLAPQPAVTPAGARFPELMAARLRQAIP